MTPEFRFGPPRKKSAPQFRTDRAGGLEPQHRLDGKPVTMRNHGPRECVWPYGNPAADMVVCGRFAEHAPYCKGHHAVAYRSKPGGVPDARDD